MYKSFFPYPIIEFLLISKLQFFATWLNLEFFLRIHFYSGTESIRASVCNTSAAATAAPTAELPHLYKTLNVQQVMYNTLDIQHMNIQHLEYTTHEHTTTWIHNTLNIQHLECTTLECTTPTCTTHKLVGHWIFVLLDICPTRTFLPLGHLYLVQPCNIFKENVGN
jgi:hypothetical protein